MRRVEGLAIVAGVVAAHRLAAACPTSVAGLGPIDAMFESMSGPHDHRRDGVRDFSQFGRGNLLLARADALAGRHGRDRAVRRHPAAPGDRRPRALLRRSVGPDDEKVTPQIRKTAAAVAALRGADVLQIVALVLAGMPLFDASATRSRRSPAAGFSPHPLSIAGYQNPAAEWVIIVFMFAAGANFALQYRALARRDLAAVSDDEEFRAYSASCSSTS